MNPEKKSHIERIRSESAYPTFRMMAELGCWIFWIIGVLGFLGFSLKSLFSGQLGMIGFIAGLIWVGVFYAAGLVFKEASLMLADLADSITDANSRHEE